MKTRILKFYGTLSTDIASSQRKEDFSKYVFQVCGAERDWFDGIKRKYIKEVVLCFEMSCGYKNGLLMQKY